MGRSGVRGRVWGELCEGADGPYWTWHYIVKNSDGDVVLYDNTANFWVVFRAVLVRVEALQHMELAGHLLEPYKGGVG